MKSALEIFFVCRTRINRELNKRMKVLPPLSSEELFSLFGSDNADYIRCDNFTKLAASLFVHSENKENVCLQLASYLDLSGQGKLSQRDLMLGLQLMPENGTPKKIQERSAIKSQTLFNLKQRLILLTDWIVDCEVQKKQLYSFELFSLEKLFNLLSADHDFISKSSVKSFFGAKIIQMPSLVNDVLELLRKGASMESDPLISMKEFRVAVTPRIHYLEALSINEEDRSLVDSKPETKHQSTEKEAVDEDYKLVEIDRPMLITTSHNSESSRQNVSQTNSEFIHLRYLGEKSPEAKKMQREPGAPLSKKYQESSDQEFDSLEHPGYSKSSKGDRFQEFADYPASTGSSEFKSPSPHLGVDSRHLQAPIKGAKAEFDDQIKKEITRKINFSEENYWNIGYRNRSEPETNLLHVPSPSLHESELVSSPVFLGGKYSKGRDSHLNTTLPKDEENRPQVSGNKHIHRQISFDNLEII